MHSLCGTNTMWSFMNVWILELRPGVREDSASPAWLVALVIFSYSETEFYFQVLVKFSSYHAKKSLPVYLYINLLFEIITSLLIKMQTLIVFPIKFKCKSIFEKNRNSLYIARNIFCIIIEMSICR